MQIALETDPSAFGISQSRSGDATSAGTKGTTLNALAHYQIIRRNGAVVPFEPNKIAVAMMKAFLAVHGTQGAASASVRETVDGLTQAVIRALMRSRPGGGTFHIEDVQDQVELGLMRAGHHEIARAYVLYREKRSQERVKTVATQPSRAAQLHVTDGGLRVVLDQERLKALIESACAGLGSDVNPEPILGETMRAPSGVRGPDAVSPPNPSFEPARICHLCSRQASAREPCIRLHRTPMPPVFERG